jgi:hypothetical protein
LAVAELVVREPYAGGPAMGRYDHIVDWFKKRHDTLIDDFEPFQGGSRRVMEFDGSEWRNVTPKMIRETRSRIEEMEFLVRSTSSAIKTRSISIHLPISERKLLPMSERRLRNFLSCRSVLNVNWSN